MAKGGTPGQVVPGEVGGAEGGGQERAASLEVGVGRNEGADQGGELERTDLAVEQGTGESHSFCLAMSGPDAGVEAADAGPETLAGSGIGGVGVGRDGPGKRGGHRGGTTGPLNDMPVSLFRV
jgi:hypothetical protein